MSVGVVIGTYGDIDVWSPLVLRAVESVNQQSVKPEKIIWRHGATLHEARNEAIETLDTEWVIMLDADDELDPLYVEAMLDGDGDIRQPATLGIQDGVEDDEPVVIPRKNLLDGNYIVIGAMCRPADVLAVGGFRDFSVLEDWDLWIRMALSGKKIVPVPKAIYRVHVNRGGRNTRDASDHGRVYSQLRSEFAGRRSELE